MPNGLIPTLGVPIGGIVAGVIILTLLIRSIVRAMGDANAAGGNGNDPASRAARLEEMAARRRAQLEELARQRRGAQAGGQAPHTPVNLTPTDQARRAAAKAEYERRAEALRRQQAAQQPRQSHPSAQRGRPVQPKRRPVVDDSAHATLGTLEKAKAENARHRAAERPLPSKAMHASQAKREREEVIELTSADESGGETTRRLVTDTDSAAYAGRSRQFTRLKQFRGAAAMRDAIVLKEVIDQPIGMRPTQDPYQSEPF